VQHCEDDVLALVALGEQPSAADASHLAGCATCRAEVESFGRVVTAGRGDRSATPAVEPPAHVWDGIAAATGVGVRPRSAAPLPPAPPVPATAPVAPPATVPQPAPVLQLRPRTRSRSGFRGLHLVAVAAAALVVGAAGGVGVTSLLGDDSPATPTVVVASTVLDPLPADPAARGKAVVVEDRGGRVLQVDVSSLGATDGFFEVWLIDSSVKKMVPIGVLSGAKGTFTIPADLDLSQYPVVDISAEPLDGNPVHSGKSLLRGVIPG
jgi:hypothetical protein